MQKSVLLSISSKDLQSALTSLLNELHYQVFVINENVLQWLKNNEIDAFIADLNIEGLSIIEICQWLRAQKSTSYIPILLINNTQNNNNVISALSAGANDCLPHNCNLQELTLKLEHLIEYQKLIYEQQKTIEGLLSLTGNIEAIVNDQFKQNQLTLAESYNPGINKVELDKIENLVQQALQFCSYETINPQSSEAVRSAISRLSISMVQANLYQQARVHAAALHEANEKLRELDRLRNEFTNAVVHDIRSPLGSVISTLELIGIELQKRNPDLPGLRELATGARHVSEKMASLIAELLDFSKLESGALHMEFVSMSPREIILDVVKSCAALAHRKNISISHGCDADLPNVQIDFKNMQRALVNLLSNAIKFTPEGGQIWLEARAIEGRHVDVGHHYIVFSVIDSGEGIPANDLPYVFDPYYQARSRTGNLGTGLGLAIVKRIIAAHGGNVSVRSQVGVGSVFSIVLPLGDRNSPDGELIAAEILTNSIEVQLPVI